MRSKTLRLAREGNILDKKTIRKASRQSLEAYFLRDYLDGINYLPGKNGHTIGITTKEITKQTMIKPVPAFT